jgi:hypothetical protein
LRAGVRLIFTILALLAAAGLIAGLSEGAGQWRSRYAAAATAVAVAVAAALVGLNLWNNVQGYQDRADSTEGVDSATASVAGGTKEGVEVSFFNWARARIGEDQTFYMYPAGPATDARAYQWGTYQLTPRLSVDDPARADWLVFYKAEPRKTGYPRADFGAPVRYGAGYYVVERRAG